MSRPNTTWTINSYDHTATAWRTDTLGFVAQQFVVQEAIEVTFNEDDLAEMLAAIIQTYPPEPEEVTSHG